MGHRFAHVVYGQGRDARAGQSLHFYTGSRLDSRRAVDDKSDRWIEIYGHFAVVKSEGMAERNKFRGALGRHNPGEYGGLKNWAFLGYEFAVRKGTGNIGRQRNDGTRRRGAPGP